MTINNSEYITSIGDYAFANCTLLNTFYAKNCTYVGQYAFKNCTNLTTVSLTSAKISNGAFSNVNLSYLSIAGTYNNLIDLFDSSNYISINYVYINDKNLKAGYFDNVYITNLDVPSGTYVDNTKHNIKVISYF